MKSYKLQALIALLIGLSIISCSDDDSDVTENIIDIENTTDPSEETPAEEETPTAEEETPTAEEEQTNEVLTGSFVGNSTYTVIGEVTINAEKTQLTIRNFTRSRGQEPLELYLFADPDLLDNPAFTQIGTDEFFALGVLPLSGEKLIYDLPEDIDIDFDTYKYLSVWCVPVGLNFGHAVLE